MRDETQAIYSIDTKLKGDDAIIDQALAILKGRLKKTSKKFNSSDAVKKYMILKTSQLDHEVFNVMFLNNQHELITIEKMFTGTIDQCSVYPREIVKAALIHNAAAVILSHNHPSGKTDPSNADINITKKIKKACELLEICVLDHIIIGGIDALSMAEKGLI